MGKQDYDKWNFRAGVDVSVTADLKFSAKQLQLTSKIYKSHIQKA
ncbi:MAG: hypothetical protein R2738_07235 [Bacteroides graminisolvens]